MFRFIRIRRALPASILLLALPLAPAAAETGEFRKAGASLACVTGNAAAQTQTPPYLDCLAIGPVRIGQTLREVAMKFGKAAKEVKQGPVTLRVWPIQDGAPVGAALPYWVIGFEGQRVVSVQLSGPRRADRFAFSSLRLGDGEARVREILGDPTDMQEVPQIGAVMWSWRPFPVTLEIRRGRVFSMRVSEAVGK